MDRDRQQLSALMKRIFACVDDGSLDSQTAARLLDVASLADVPHPALPPVALHRAILSFEVHYQPEQEVAFAPTPQTENRLRHASEALAWALDLGGMVYVGPVGIYLDRRSREE